MDFFRGLFRSNSGGRGGHRGGGGGDDVHSPEDQADNAVPRPVFSRSSSLPLYKPTARPPMSKAESSVTARKHFQQQHPQQPHLQQPGMNRSRTLSPPRFSWKSPLRSLSSLLPLGASAGAEAATADRLVEEAQLREAILHQLTHAVQMLVKEEVDVSAGRGEPVELVTLPGNLPGVQELCLAVEQACFHGIKTASFHGQLPFWDLVELIEERDKQQEMEEERIRKIRNKPAAATATGAPVVALIAAAKKAAAAAKGGGGEGEGEEGLSKEEAAALEEERQEERRALRQLVDYVRRAICLRTPVGKARCFLRHALHDGTLTAVMRHVIRRPFLELRLFYHSDAIVLHRDDSSLFLELLASITEHFRLDLTGDMDAPALDHEPRWPLLDLATTAARRRRESEEGKDRGILAAALIDDLTHWRLEEDNEVKTLEAFHRVDSFNSSAKRVGQRDPVLDALLETSGVVLKHVGGGREGGRVAVGGLAGEQQQQQQQQQQGGEKEEAEIVELVEAGGGIGGRSCHRLLHEQQHRSPSEGVICPAAEAAAVATAAAAAGAARAGGGVGEEEEEEEGGAGATALRDVHLATPPRRKQVTTTTGSGGSKLRNSSSLPSSPTHLHPISQRHPHSPFTPPPRNAVTPATTTTRLAHPNRHTPINFASSTSTSSSSSSSSSSPHRPSGLPTHHTHHPHHTAIRGGPPHSSSSGYHSSSSPGSSPSHGSHGSRSPHAHTHAPRPPSSPCPSSPPTSPSLPTSSSFDNEATHGPVIVPSKDFLLTPGRGTLRYQQQHPAPHQRKLFGAPLAHLVRDLETCRFALLEPSLGVPYIYEAMLGFLESHLHSTPKLFETKVSGWRVSGLSKVLDEYQEVPPGSDPPVVAATLNLALRMLPEPLLTYEAYHAFLSAARLPDLAERQATVKGLLRDLPLEHKPTLRKLMHLLWKACHHPQSPKKEGGREGGRGIGHGQQHHHHHHRASSHTLAPIFCRSFLQSYLPEVPQRQQQQPLQQHMQQQQVLSLPPSTVDPPEAVALTQELIDHYPSYFHELRDDEASKAQALQMKVQRLSAIVDASKQPADGEKDPECLAMFKILFAFLARVEERAHRASSVLAMPIPRFRQHALTDDFGCIVGGGGGSEEEGEEGGAGGGRGGRSRSQSLPDAAALAAAVAAAREEKGREEGEGESMVGGRRHGGLAGVAGTSLSVLPTSDDDSGDGDAEAEEKDEEALADTTPFSFAHPRWECCGFIRGDPGCELGLSGKLTLQCIVRFIRRFPCIAAEMIFQYSHHGRKGSTISFPALCGQVTRLVLGLLHLLPPSDGQPLSVAAFAQAPYWRLLDDPHAVEEVFCVALTLMDFLHFHEALPMEAVEPHILETKRQVSWALAQGPVSMQSLWELWLAVRAELRRRYREDHRREEEAEEEEGRRRRKSGREEEETEVDLACFWEADPEDDHVVYKVSKGVRSRMLGKSAILAPWQVITLERSLPEEHQDRDWLLLYSLKKHGAAMHSIFERCKGHRYTLLCLMDEDGWCFGGMASEEWKDRKDRYFGSGESFLFSFKGDKFVKYTWTRSNSYFMLASHGIGLAMGGGGHFGLFVGPDLMRGSSDHCETFGSATLSGEKTFDVVNIEVWGFGTPAGMVEEKEERPKGLAESLAEHRDYQNDNV